MGSDNPDTDYLIYLWLKPRPGQLPFRLLFHLRFKLVLTLVHCGHFTTKRQGQIYFPVMYLSEEGILLI